MGATRVSSRWSSPGLIPIVAAISPVRIRQQGAGREGTESTDWYGPSGQFQAIAVVTWLLQTPRAATRDSLCAASRYVRTRDRRSGRQLQGRRDRSAPDAKLFVIKASHDGSADPTSISTIAMANGIVYAADHGVNVLNISASSPNYSTVVHNALAYAYAHNVLVIAAVGNEGTSVPNYPAADPNAIAVGATDQTDRRASFPSYGSSWVSIAAPGAYIASTAPTYPTALFEETGYAIDNGTSYAAPMVAAAAALLRPLTTDTNANGKTADDVAVRLVGYSEAVAGTASEWLAGRLDICLAIHKVWAPCSPAPLVATPPVADPQPAAPVKPAVPSTPVTTPKADPDALSRTAAVSAAKKYVTRRMMLKKYKLTCTRDNASGFICRVTWKKGKRSCRQGIHVWRDGKTYVEKW